MVIHLDLSTPTRCESGAMNIAGFATDVDNIIRQGNVGSRRAGSLLKFIDTFLDFEKISIGTGYDEILFEFIPPNITSNLNQENIANLTEDKISCIIDIETDGLPKTQINGAEFQTELPNIIQLAWLLMDSKGNILKKETELKFFFKKMSLVTFLVFFCL